LRERRGGGELELRATSGSGSEVGGEGREKLGLGRRGGRRDQRADRWE